MLVAKERHQPFVIPLLRDFLEPFLYPRTFLFIIAWKIMPIPSCSKTGKEHLPFLNSLFLMIYN